MSIIRGTGWGDRHNWKRPDYLQIKIPDQFGRLISPVGGPTIYQCADCGIVFYHDYHYKPNIFEAMKDALVPTLCQPRAWEFRSTDSVPGKG